MFNVKRNGTNVEITNIPLNIPASVFKDIAGETGADGYLVVHQVSEDSYKVVIYHNSENMASTVAWMALEASEPEADDADISTIGKRIGVVRVKQHMSTQELEDAIGAPEGSVFRWETGKAIPSNKYINCLAAVLECDPQWLLNGNSNYKNKLPPDCESRNTEEAIMIAMRDVSRTMEKHKINSLFKPYYILVI
ncbi:helix-turn-helix domain-containing protein [Salmonella enterica subsp. enterica serovar Ball]|nr:hypothetical protein [Salmonella enterica subsp. salamae]EDV5021651.1 helix-turn-helix domain-containing protein [Salmonella enterica subsp. enterica serovar Ball]